jgi:hypothetical protein
VSCSASSRAGRSSKIALMADPESLGQLDLVILDG